MPVFRQIDSIPTKKQTVTLHDYFYPDVLKYKLHSDGGVLAASLRDGNDDGPQRKGVDLSLLDFSFPLPLFCPSEVSICNKNSKHALTEYPTKVLVGKETICYLKVFSPGWEREALREIKAYIRINELEIRDGLHVPFLFGLVQGEDSTSCLGLLLSYIDCNNMTLESIVSDNTPKPLRQRWADQVTSTVRRVHEAEIVWGDAKAANVLVDLNMDAWIIDFGGGFTQGWVQRENAGTVEGDSQGLAKIVDHIFALSET